MPATAKPDFTRLQYEFTAHIRDPEHKPAPAGIEDRRMRIYRELFYNNVEGFLSNAFPVIRELLNENEYDIFICDIHMGRERGTDLLSEFSDRLDEANTQVVMCSAYGQYRYLREEMGADYFLEQPISLGTLLTLVSRLMEPTAQKI